MRLAYIGLSGLIGLATGRERDDLSKCYKDVAIVEA